MWSSSYAKVFVGFNTLSRKVMIDLMSITHYTDAEGITRIYLSGGGNVLVDETYDEVTRRIKKSLNS